MAGQLSTKNDSLPNKAWTFVLVGWDKTHPHLAVRLPGFFCVFFFKDSYLRVLFV